LKPNSAWQRHLRGVGRAAADPVVSG
jgi:hypothetical protein